MELYALIALLFTAAQIVASDELSSMTHRRVERVKRQCGCSPQQLACVCVQLPQLCTCNPTSPCACAPSPPISSSSCLETCQSTCVRSCMQQYQSAAKCQMTCAFTCQQACNKYQLAGTSISNTPAIAVQSPSISQLSPQEQSTSQNCTSRCQPQCVTICIGRNFAPSDCERTCQKTCSEACIQQQHVMQSAPSIEAMLPITSTIAAPQIECIPACMPACLPECTSEAVESLEIATTKPIQITINYEPDNATSSAVATNGQCLDHCLSSCVQLCIHAKQPASGCISGCSSECGQQCPTQQGSFPLPEQLQTAAAMQQSEIASPVQHTQQASPQPEIISAPQQSQVIPVTQQLQMLHQSQVLYPSPQRLPQIAQLPHQIQPAVQQTQTAHIFQQPQAQPTHQRPQVAPVLQRPSQISSVIQQSQMAPIVQQHQQSQISQPPQQQLAIQSAQTQTPCSATCQPTCSCNEDQQQSSSMTSSSSPPLEIVAHFIPDQILQQTVPSTPTPSRRSTSFEQCQQSCLLICSDSCSSQREQPVQQCQQLCPAACSNECAEQTRQSAEASREQLHQLQQQLAALLQYNSTSTPPYTSALQQQQLCLPHCQRACESTCTFDKTPVYLCGRLCQTECRRACAAAVSVYPVRSIQQTDPSAQQSLGCASCSSLCPSACQQQRTTPTESIASRPAVPPPKPNVVSPSANEKCRISCIGICLPQCAQHRQPSTICKPACEQQCTKLCNRKSREVSIEPPTQFENTDIDAKSEKAI